jgi:hypothetical protein
MVALESGSSRSLRDVRSSTSFVFVTFTSGVRSNVGRT